MILQPLVENSVKHAVAPSGGQVTITLSAREEYGRLVVSVSDNGASSHMPDDVRPGFGIGLNNVRERLQARFGNEASIVSGHAQYGFATHLRLPLLRMKEMAAA
jgi:LytS/YehU family sensor histidine kinase